MIKSKEYNGLSDTQVLEMRKLYGNNELSAPPKESIWHLLLEKFQDPLIVVLLIALTLSVGVSTYQYVTATHSISVFLEPVGILIAIILATTVAFIFEVSANKKFDILNQENEIQAIKVLRNGNYCLVPRKDIVVGDIVILDTGDEIPADGQLLDAHSMLVNESVLTGEPSAQKTIDSEHFDDDATYPSDQVMRGTTVIDGNGVMKVTLVGDKTEYGKVYKGSQIDNKIKTPLNIQLEKLSTNINVMSYVVAAIIIIGRALQFFNSDTLLSDGNALTIGQYILDTLMIAVAIIVVAVPEGLPMSITLSLALSMRRMLVANNLVRKMHACETMGAATVICTDKTGTLTQNQMRIAETHFTNNSEDSLIAQLMAINSTANLNFSTDKVEPIGNPTEAALLLWLYEKGIDYRQLRSNAEIVVQLAFSTERKYMATLIKYSDTENLLFVKGAPEILMNMCNDTLNEEQKTEINNQLLNCQNRAMRTLGFAYARIANNINCFVQNKLTYIDELTFLGFVAISDPVRTDVPQAVAQCLSAGINVKIVTGDTPATAHEIGKQIGLIDNTEDSSAFITGAEFSALDHRAALIAAENIKIMSRARPMDKARLVKLLQEQGEVVAVTGDGTNDAPALKAAQIGLSMGDGTSAAKQASAITIIDNSFKSINKAVLWGRSLYRNIQRFILFQLTINVAACLIVMIGAFTGIESPLTVTQMLWVNIIMDTFAAMALASLPPENNVMNSKPRDPKAHIITKPMIVTILASGLTIVAFLIAFMHLLQTHRITSIAQLLTTNYQALPTDANMTLYEHSVFFTVFVLIQFWNMFNAKAFSTNQSTFANIINCRNFLLILFVILIGQILIINIGGQMFSVTTLSLSDWILIIAATSIVLWIGELIRLFGRLSNHFNKK